MQTPGDSGKEKLPFRGRKLMLWIQIMLPKGSRYRVKRIGPSTEPCGTQWFTIEHEEELLLTWSNWYLFDKYNLKHLNAATLIHISCSTLCNQILWSMVSTAALRSNKTYMDAELLSEAIRITSVTLINAVSVQWWTLNPDWTSSNKPFLCRWSHNNGLQLLFQGF